MGNNDIEHFSSDSFVNNDEAQIIEEKVNYYKQEIRNYLEKMVKYQKLSKIMLFAGLIVIALSLLLSSYLPYTKKVAKKKNSKSIVNH